MGLSSIEAKQDVILDPRISARDAEILISSDSKNIEVLKSDNVITKLSENCDKICKKHKEEVLNKAEEAESLSVQQLETKENELTENIDRHDQASKTLTEISEFFLAY